VGKIIRSPPPHTQWRMICKIKKSRDPRYALQNDNNNKKKPVPSFPRNPIPCGGGQERKEKKKNPNAEEAASCDVIWEMEGDDGGLEKGMGRRKRCIIRIYGSVRCFEKEKRGK
jgi:hypothetical protein